MKPSKYSSQKIKLDRRILTKFLPRFRLHIKSLIFCVILMWLYSFLSLLGLLLVRQAIDVDFLQKSVKGVTKTAFLYLVIQ